MFKYFISLFLVLSFFDGHAQSKPIDLQPKDTADYRQPYGLRVGVDLSRPVLSFFDEDYTGLELVGDYRLNQKLYLGVELGTEEKTQQEDLFNFTTSGSYLKLGIDFNTYENWYGMNNSIYIGGRYAYSTFTQTLNNFQFFDSNRYFSPDDFVQGATDPVEFDGLNASWLEFIFGVKAELFANIYLGASVRLGFLITEKEADNFPNLWIPGFNKVTDGSNFGVGYNYSISYFIPLYKKAKKPKDPEVESDN
ncbi:DUF6048 family protein [Flavobacteriaceae bacterium 3-367]|uniref:DUF6048 family protein n=1 Tax=Eudoraea algarum TaxID=3417568 RepID=UPI00327FE7DD